ncbi:Uncharacterised protein [Mycobacteroides abscessus subsp. abscessus]|nr:Uncharacterised protein [Mycobacteroides abscessus subsp. abscessus]
MANHVVSPWYWMRPASMTRILPAAITSAAATGSLSGISSMRAQSFPVPMGMTPSATGVAATACSAMLTRPSPPAATIPRAPVRAASCASACDSAADVAAWCVTVSPRARKCAMAASAACAAACPAVGLVRTVRCVTATPARESACRD